MTLRPYESIKPGDVFLNLKRFSMLRVKRVDPAGVWADYVSWRPDGTRGSNLGKVRLKALTMLPYLKCDEVRVYAAGQCFQFPVEPKEAHGIIRQLDPYTYEEITGEEAPRG